MNKPAAVVRAISDKGPIGDWLVSTWLTRYPWSVGLQEEIGSIMPGVALSEGQQFTYDGRTYQITLRPVRYYKPYSVTLLAFNHDLYPGTDIPKNFSSKVHLHDANSGEDRDVLIYMNNPLRYRGETYFQASFEPGDRGTILQVVRNPASFAPYVACSLVGFGLLVQFLTHLVKFARKRAPAANPAPTRAASAGVPVAPVLTPKRSVL